MFAFPTLLSHRCQRFFVLFRQCFTLYVHIVVGRKKKLSILGNVECETGKNRSNAGTSTVSRSICAPSYLAYDPVKSDNFSTSSS